MSTDIRPEVSVKNKYWISRHRYYELKHFCLQYGEWKQAYNSCTVMSWLRSYGFLLYSSNASYAALYVGKYASGLSGTRMY